MHHVTKNFHFSDPHDLNARVSEGFQRVDADLREIRSDMKAMQRLIAQVGGGLFGTMLIGFLGLLVTQH